MTQVIQGTQFSFQAVEVEDRREIVLFADYCPTAIAVVLCFPDGEMLIQFRHDPYLSVSEARLMTSALQQAAAIASDFDTWWEDHL